MMDEWKDLGHRDEGEDNTWAGYYNVRRNAEERRVLGRSRSATNIMIKGFQYFSRASSVSRAASVFSEDRLTDMTDFDEVRVQLFFPLFILLCCCAFASYFRLG